MQLQHGFYNTHKDLLTKNVKKVWIYSFQLWNQISLLLTSPVDDGWSNQFYMQAKYKF